MLTETSGIASEISPSVASDFTASRISGIRFCRSSFAAVRSASSRRCTDAPSRSFRSAASRAACIRSTVSFDAQQTLAAEAPPR